MTDRPEDPMDDAALVAGEPLERIVAQWRASAPPVSAQAAAAIAARARLQAGTLRDTGRTVVPWRPIALAAAAGLAVIVGVQRLPRGGDAPAAPAIAAVPDVRTERDDDAQVVLAPATTRAGAAEAFTAAARSVRLVLDAPAATRVHAVGDFNQWSLEATPLVRDPLTGQWSVVLQLVPGRYRYSFLVDGRRFVADPAHESVHDTDFGQPTSELLVEVRP